MQYAPKHLSRPVGSPALGRLSTLLQWLALMAAAAVVTMLVLPRITDRLESGTAPSRPRPSAATRAASATTGAVAPTTGAATGVPATPTTRAVRPRGDNLLPDGGFEAGLAGWQPVGGAGLERVADAREGGWAVRLTGGTSAEPGLAAPRVVRCRAMRAYAATVWVRASAPGTVVQVNLLEHAHGARMAVDAVGGVLPDTGWHQLQVVHPVHRPGANLALEVLAPGLPAAASVLVDDVRVAAKSASFMSATTS